MRCGRHLEAVIGSIKAAGDLESCKKHHIEAIHSGLCSSIVVANTLIRAYARCGSVVDAARVFQSLESPDLVSWNALLHGLVENGHSGKALGLVRTMEQGGWIPDARTFVTVLKACSNLGQAAEEQQDCCSSKNKENKSVELAKLVSFEAMASKQLDVFVANALIDTFGKCGKIDDARSVFDRMPAHDVVSWTTLIQAYVDNDESKIALEIFAEMESRGCVGNSWTFSAALMGCSRLAASEEFKIVDGNLLKAESIESGIWIHSRAAGIGCESNIFVGNTLIDMYSRCGDMVRARRVFDGMKIRDVISWTTLIQGFAENGHPESALEFFSGMKLANCKPDSGSYVAALVTCSGLADSAKSRGESIKLVECLDRSRMIYADAAIDGFEQDLFVNTAAVRAYSKCGSSAKAREIFDRATNRDTYLYNAMLLGYVENGDDAAVLDLFDSMHEQGLELEIDARTLSAALAACARLGSKPESNSGSASKSGSNSESKTTFLERGIAIHSEATKSGFDKSDIFVGNALIDMYSKCGSLELAVEAFDAMPEKDVVSWTSMMMGYVDNGRPNLALDIFFSRMDVAANAATYVVAMVACGNLVAIETGKAIEGRVYRAGIEHDRVVATAVVDFYAKCGEIAAGRRVFDSAKSVVTKDVKLWNAVIAGYGHCGELNRALSMFNGMRDEGIAADAITFSSMLAVCSHAGEIETGQAVFRAMVGVGIVPGVQHYSCLIDLFGRASRLDEAVEIVEAMPVEADSVALSACQRWKDVKVGEKVFVSLLNNKKAPESFIQ